MINTAEQGFNWELYSHNKGNRLTKNEFVKTQGNDRVYCYDTYAQYMYDLFSNKDFKSNKDLNEGGLYMGVVFSVSEQSCVSVTDSGQSIYIDIRKEDRDCDKLGIPRINFTVGQGLNLIVSKNIQGYYTGSVVEGFFQSIKIELFDSIKSESSAYNVKVKSVNKGGFIVDLSGIECFLPGSLAAANKIINFESYIGKEIPVMVDGYLEDKDMFVVSHKKYIQKIMDRKVQELDISKKYTGRVTGTSNFGVFVELEDFFTGLIHKTEFEDHSTISNFKEGDNVDIYIKEIKEDNRLTLTFNPPLEKTLRISELKNEWSRDIVKTVECEIKAIRNSGILVDLVEYSLLGMIPSSKGGSLLAKYKKPGDLIKADIIGIDIRSEKITLKSIE
jgi:ribosomal protein S1